jgi:hypothetical protein
MSPRHPAVLLLAPVVAFALLTAAQDAPKPEATRFLDQLTPGLTLQIGETKDGRLRVSHHPDLPSVFTVAEVGVDHFVYTDPVGARHFVPVTSVHTFVRWPKPAR